MAKGWVRTQPEDRGQRPGIKPGTKSCPAPRGANPIVRNFLSSPHACANRRISLKTKGKFTEKSWHFYYAQFGTLE